MTRTHPIFFRHAITAWALLAALLPAWAPPAEAKLPPAPFKTATTQITKDSWFEFEWSPKKLVFAVNTGREIRLVDGKTLKAKILYAAPPRRHLQALSWAPDGTRLAVTEGPVNLRVPANSTTPYVAKSVLLLNIAKGKAAAWPAGPIGSSNLIWTADGKRLVYATGVMLRAIDAATGAHTDICEAPLGAIESASRGPGALLYIINAEGVMDGLWTVDLDARKATPSFMAGNMGPGALNPNFIFLANVAVRPKAGSVAFDGNLTNGGFAIDLWDPDTNRVRLAAEGASFPVWSPDGRWLFYAVDSGDGLAVMDMDNNQTYTVSPIGNGRVKISADGTRILHSGGDMREDQGVFLTTITAR